MEPLLTNDAQGMYRMDNHAWLFGWSNGTVFQVGSLRARIGLLERCRESLNLFHGTGARKLGSSPRQPKPGFRGWVHLRSRRGPTHCHSCQGQPRDNDSVPLSGSDGLQQLN